jgi:alkylhydroperoxidase/carboxymuconolactone decarboxylase family protein YurZ
VSDSVAMKNKFYDWTNEMLVHSPFDAKTNHLMSLVAALARGDQGSVSYFYFRAKSAGASEAELAAATIHDLAYARS